MPLLAAAVALGALLAFYGNELPDSSWSALLPMLLWFAYCRPGYRFVAAATAAYLWSCAAFHDHLQHRLVDSFDHEVTTIRGRVTEIPEVGQDRIRLYLQDLEIDGYSGPTPRLARLNWYQHSRVPRPGELWQFQVKLKQPRGLRNPFGFDYESWLFVQGIDATGYIRDSALNRRLEAAAAMNLDRWRTYLADRVADNCRDCQQLGLIKGLALGYRGDITPRQRSLLQSTGTAHLLAISGMHIGLVAWLFYALGRCSWRFGLYRLCGNRQILASMISMGAAVAYAALAGFSLPTQRALIMLLVVFAALCCKSRVNLLHSASLALLLILIYDPRAIGSLSLWLSFGALLIIAVSQFRFPGKLSWWRQLLLLQCCFSLLMLPLSTLTFDQANPAALMANLLAIPLLGFLVLPLVLSAACLSPLVPGFAGLLLQLADNLLAYLMRALEFLLELGFGAISTAEFPALLALLVLAAMLILMLPGKPLAGGVALITLLLPLCWRPDALPRGAYELLILDVGMGTSVLLRTRHHSLVYDFGPGRKNAYSAAQWALAPALARYAIDSPDLAILSHVDQDHSGGLHLMLPRLRPQSLLTGTPSELVARFASVETTRDCHDYPDWRWDGVDFRFLDTGAKTGSTNSRSCVLMVEGHHRALLPGDIEAPQERKLVTAYGAALAAELLLVPHHGSATSSSPEFVERVRPQYVVYTQSRHNRWGFPRGKVVARYRALASRQFQSSRDGAIRVQSQSSGLIVKSAAGPARRIWQRW